MRGPRIAGAPEFLFGYRICREITATLKSLFLSVQLLNTGVPTY